MDMSRPYRSAVEEFLPEVKIVFDRFHIMQLINRTVDKVRKKQQVLLDKKGYQTLKGRRFLIMKNYDNLDDKQRKRLDHTLEANEPLMIVHTMKEQLRLLWSETSYKKGRKFLTTWIVDAIETACDYELKTGSKVLKPLRNLALSIARHIKGILNYFKYRITNGKIEGINNKIKTLKRQAYGFRDMNYFTLRLFHLHEQKNRLAG